jgi:hypothetical protein
MTPAHLSHVVVEVHELLVAIKVVGVMVMVVLVEVGKEAGVESHGLLVPGKKKRKKEGNGDEDELNGFQK